MLAELDVVVFLKSHDGLEQVADRVFGVLGSSYEVGESEELGAPACTARGLGFQAVLYENAGDAIDPEFEEFEYALEITSNFWCVELDTVDLEGPLSEYFARQLAFGLNLETATEILLETTEYAEIYDIRVYRRNPQYRFDQSPTTPKVFVIESRQVEEPYDEEFEDDVDGDEGDGDAYEEDEEDTTESSTP